MTAEELRELAKEYLRIAAQMSNYADAERLRELAAEYSREAKRMEAQASIDPPAPNQEERKD
jgi:hypothetical protein